MDVYLPADFYRLRDELSDWRDAPASSPQKSPMTDKISVTLDPETRSECADPNWRVI